MDSKDHPTPPRRQTAENGSDDGQSPLAAGTQIRQYKVTAPLQNSGSGRVYLALDLSSGERVVIKPVAADTAPSKNKPLEASILSRFHHPNAVRFDEMVEDASGRYLVFEYIEGMDLETFLQKVGPEIGESALRDLLRPVADALEALHGLGFIHRDLKPANLRIRDSGTPVLVDFYADWCGPCRMLSPVLEELARETPEARIVKIDVDKSPEIAAKYGVNSIPMLVLFKDGEPKSQIIGLAPKSTLRQLLSK